MTLGVNPNDGSSDSEDDVNPGDTIGSHVKSSRSAALKGSSMLGQSRKSAAILGGMTMGGVGTKKVEKRTITDRAKKDRERRRRKQIVDQSKTLMEMEHKNRED